MSWKRKKLKPYLRQENLKKIDKKNNCWTHMIIADRGFRTRKNEEFRDEQV